MEMMKSNYLLSCAAANKPVSECLLLIFDIVKRWIADTGCGHDMVSRRQASHVKEQLINIPPITFGTANGPAAANLGVPLKIPIFGDQYATPYVMASTPALLSVGMRVMHHMFSFIWLPGKRPFSIACLREQPIHALIAFRGVNILSRQALLHRLAP